MNKSILRLFFFLLISIVALKSAHIAGICCMRTLSESKEVTGRVDLSISVLEERLAGNIMPVRRSVNGHASHNPFQWALLEGRSKFLPPWTSQLLCILLLLLDLQRPLCLDLSPGFSSSASIHRFPSLLLTPPVRSCSKYLGFC